MSNENYNYIKETLVRGLSKEKAEEIAQMGFDDPKHLEEIMNCFFSKNLRHCQAAAWPLGKLGIKHPHLVAPYIGKMLKHIDNPVHDAAIRNTVRVLQEMDIPEEYVGAVYEKCFNYLSNPEYAVAIRVFSMTILTNIAHHFPELIPELIWIIEEHIPHGSTAFQSRGKKELKRLRKLLSE